MDDEFIDIKSFLKSKTFYNYLIAIGIIIVFVFGMSLFSEIKESKKFCDSVDGVYKINFLKGKYLCNNRSIVKYTFRGWDFEDLNLSEIKNG